MAQVIRVKFQRFLVITELFDKQLHNNYVPRLCQIQQRNALIELRIEITFNILYKSQYSFETNQTMVNFK